MAKLTASSEIPPCAHASRPCKSCLVVTSSRVMCESREPAWNVIS